MTSAEARIPTVYIEILVFGDQSGQKALEKWCIRNINILRNVLQTPGIGQKALFIGDGHVPFITGIAHSLGVPVEKISDII